MLEKRTEMSLISNQFQRQINIYCFSLCLLGLLSCTPLVEKSSQNPVESGILPPDPTLIVDCQLPARIKRLGPSSTYLGSRRAIKTSSQDCEIRGGEYIAYDRANWKSALDVWLPSAKGGNAQAQYYVGTIYTKNNKNAEAYQNAVLWFTRAAEQDHSAAQYSLAYLYEHGLGIKMNPQIARYWYQKAAGLQTAKIDTLRSNRLDLKSAINIELIEPHLPPTRNPIQPPIILSKNDSAIENIQGVLKSTRPINFFSINDIAINTDQQGHFSTQIKVPATGTLVDFVAVDDLGYRATQQLVLSRKALDSSKPAKTNRTLETLTNNGNYYALVIGNNRYQHLPDLRTPKNDVRALRKILRQKYGFFQVRTLFNANRYQIITALNALRYELTEDDNLLIYYAGHGELDKINKRSQWLPVDAEPNNTANWISDSALSELINAMQAKHIIVIADSCYAGMMTRSVFDNVFSNTQINSSFLDKKSRTVLTSGGVSPVLDVGGGQHSIFADALLRSLDNNSQIIKGQQLYRQVSASVSVAAASMSIDQIPEYAPIEFSSHEAGDFVFEVK